MTDKDIIKSQEKYIDSQIDLYHRILDRALGNYNSPYSEAAEVAKTIYTGYVISDLTDAINELREEVEQWQK